MVMAAVVIVVAVIMVVAAAVVGACEARRLVPCNIRHRACLMSRRRAPTGPRAPVSPY